MKKSFKLTAENKKPERQVDSVKYEIKKYITRERKKKLPESFDFWDFDCKIGENEQVCSRVQVFEINSAISQLASEDKESFYLEILAKPGNKPPKQES
ncbi:MAG: hypothetical protein HOE90_20960 [Bacteriovoracaceae bacterium]|jgi:hypothetical protein|nr:hypothetical protein [Bacteriovoracaceae bacterium]